jgi:hypothetical protein
MVYSFSNLLTFCAMWKYVEFTNQGGPTCQPFFNLPPGATLTGLRADYASDARATRCHSAPGLSATLRRPHPFFLSSSAPPLAIPLRSASLSYAMAVKLQSLTIVPWPPLMSTTPPLVLYIFPAAQRSSRRQRLPPSSSVAAQLPPPTLHCGLSSCCLNAPWAPCAPPPRGRATKPSLSDMARWGTRSPSRPVAQSVSEPLPLHRPHWEFQVQPLFVRLHHIGHLQVVTMAQNHFPVVELRTRVFSSLRRLTSSASLEERGRTSPTYRWNNNHKSKSLSDCDQQDLSVSTQRPRILDMQRLQVEYWTQAY